MREKVKGGSFRATGARQKSRSQVLKTLGPGNLVSSSAVSYADNPRTIYMQNGKYFAYLKSVYFEIG
jgi:hypothetical protein